MMSQHVIGWKRLIQCGAALIVLCPDKATAELIFEIDVVAAEYDLVSDLQDISPDPKYFSEETYEAVREYTSNLSPATKNVLQSELQEVCPLLSLSDAFGNHYSFRSNHALGSLDWSVQVPHDRPNTASYLALVSVPSGAPGLLPPLQEGQERDIAPSPQMNCMSKEDRAIAEKEIIDACKELPDRCRFIYER